MKIKYKFSVSAAFFLISISGILISLTFSMSKLKSAYSEVSENEKVIDNIYKRRDQIRRILMIESFSELEKPENRLEKNRLTAKNSKFEPRYSSFDMLDLEQQILKAHYLKLETLNEFNAIYKNEKNSRHLIRDEIYKEQNLHQIKLFGELSYKSKEAIFQYQDLEHFNYWIEIITNLKAAVTDKELIKKIDRYRVTSERIKFLLLEINLFDKTLNQKMLEYNTYLQITDKEINAFQFEQEKFIEQTIASINLEVKIILGIFVLVLYSLVLFVRKQIINPIENLRNKTKEIYESKELSEIKGFDSKDEIGELGRYFNLMIEQLSGLYHSLEEKVDEKTKDLKAINLNLHAEISERKKLEDKLERQIITDELTGCFNRRGAYMFLEVELCKIKRSANKMTIAFIDLDNLKMINDRLGHHIGDKYLADFVSLTRCHLRKEDYFCRIGGDEFLIIFNPSNEKQAREIIEKRITPHLISERNIEFSYGLAEISTANNLSIDELIKEADQKMYACKKSKKESSFCSDY